MSAAHDIMRRFNSNALIGTEDGHAVMIEDVSDPDGRMYRMEYQSSDDGAHATARCLHNPWGGVNGGADDVHKSHVFSDGLLCMGRGRTGLFGSPFDLSAVIQRARYWCTAFSVLKETGRFPQP
jgi:hypothetical protein